MAIGLRYTIQQQSDTGTVTKEVFLPTWPNPAQREAFAKAKRAFRDATFGMQKAAQRYAAAKRKVSALDPATDAYDAAVDAQDVALEQLQHTEDAAYEKAESIVRMSLARNYSKAEVDGVLDAVSQRDLLGMVALINTGELPADFFQPSEPPPSPTVTGGSGERPAGSSEATDTPKRKSKRGT